MRKILKLDPSGGDPRALELEDAIDDAAGIKIEDQDTIRSIRLPAGWLEDLSSQSRQMGNSRMHLFTSPDHETHIYYWDAAVPITKESYLAFCEVTANGAHLLKSAEIPKLSQTLRQLFVLTANVHDDLILLSAKTKELNGKRVLVLQSKVKGTGTEILSFYWDAGKFAGDARIQMIAFQGAGKSFSHNLSAAQKCFSSIEWR
jgi:hypothetical protein